MCYVHGSIEHSLGICPMCKVYKPSGRCPHVRDVCRNRVNHPRCDILYLTNAEVQCFNGCGYCKWAAAHPPVKSSGYSNQGWPGCCRAPTAAEYRMVQPADWPSVSIVHGIQIPSDVKAILDSLSARASLPGTARVISGATSAVSSVPDRKLSKPNTASMKSSAPLTPPRTRQQLPPPSASASDVPRREDKRADSTNNSPARQSIDLDSSITPRRKGEGKGQATTIPSKTPSQARKSSSSSISPPTKPLLSNPKSPSPQSSPVMPPRKRPEPAPSDSSSSSGSDGLGSMTDSTLTSDGGFTDYLSDESEAELQRQAEHRAALFAQNQMEELEFKLARQQLTHVDLRPPKSWNPSNSPRILAATLPRS